MENNNIKLPLDLELEILSWLPVESVIRFRSISKTWNVATKEVSFVDKHISRSTTRDRTTISFLVKKSSNYFMPSENNILHHHKVVWEPSLIMTTLRPGNEFVPTSLAFPPWVQYITRSCNGLVCLTSYDFMRPQHYKFGTAYSHYEYSYTYICNPATQEYLQLDRLREDDPLKNEYYVSGFGYDPRRKEYKVVMFGKMRRELPGRSIAVCTIPVDRETGPWRILHRGFPTLYTSGMAVCVDTRLHWLSIPVSGGKFVVLTFDLHDESFHYIDLPDMRRSSNHQDLKYLMLSELNGCLALVDYAKRTLHIKLWVMEEYGNHESWRLRFSFTRFLWVYFPLYLLWKEDKLLVFSDNYVFSYDPTTDSGVVVLREEQKPNAYYSTTITPFITSIVSLKGAVKCWTNK